MDRLDSLYKCAESLTTGKDNTEEQEKNYTTILDAVTSQVPKEKMLASQFIARFAKLFPNLSTKSVEAMFDLCEDSDVTVRKQVINDMPTFCRDFKGEIPNVTYVVLQLIKTDDASEVASIHKALLNLIRINSRGTFTGIFSLLGEADQATRLKIFKFLGTKLKQMETSTIAPEAETFMLAESRKLLKSLSSEEFTLLLEALKHTRIGKSVSGQQTLADLAIDFSEAVATKDSQVSALEDAVVSLKIALPFFCSAVRSSRLLKYVGEQLFPRFSDLSEAHRRDLLKTLALLTAHAGEIENPKELLMLIYSSFLETVPAPPAENDEKKVNFDFSTCEAVLFAIHKLCSKVQEFLTEDQERLSQFRLRLQYLSRSVIPYMRAVSDELKKLKPEEKETDDSKKKQISLKVLSNVHAIIIDLMKNPPVYTKIIKLSFDTTKEASATAEPQKRQREAIQFEGAGGKKDRLEGRTGRGGSRQPYSVPGGKYSSNAGGYGENRGRSGFRGRGRGRGRY